MKNGWALVENMIVVIALGLVTAIVVPALNVANKKQKMVGFTDAEKNEEAIKDCNFKKIAEFRGYDIYTFRSECNPYSVAIPSTNSVYDLERK